MAELKPAYLVCGDDDAKIDAWRARPASGGTGPGTRRSGDYDAGSATPARWRRACRGAQLRPGDPLPAGRRRGRLEGGAAGPSSRAHRSSSRHRAGARGAGKALKQLIKAVEQAGGEVREYAAPKPWQLPKWCVERARELGLQLDGRRRRAWWRSWAPAQQRLSRELEKIALALHPAVNASLGDVERHAAGDAAPVPTIWRTPWWPATAARRWRWPTGSRRTASSPGRLLYPIVRRLREVHRAALLEAGMSEQKVGEALRRPAGWPRRPWPGQKRPIPPHWSGPCACSPTWRWTCAAVGTCGSTRTPRVQLALTQAAALARSLPAASWSAMPNDAAVVAAIYNEGIEERGSTFETARRSPADVEAWLEAGERFPLLVAEEDATVSGWAGLGRYSEREAYAGVGRPRCTSGEAPAAQGVEAPAAHPAGLTRDGTRATGSSPASSSGRTPPASRWSVVVAGGRWERTIATAASTASGGT